MGIFDFVKDVGAMVGIGSAEAAPAAEDLKKEAEKHGLDTKDLKIEVDGDKVKVDLGDEGLTFVTKAPAKVRAPVST